MAVQNPTGLDYQMKAFSKEGEKDVYVPYIAGQPQTPVPLGFTEKPKTTSTAQSILQTEALTSPTQILKKEGISSSKQLLESMKVPTSKEILASAGITSPTDILESEKKKQDAQMAVSKEMQLRQEELDYMKNFKFDVNVFNPSTYDTKYGELDFDNSYVYNDYRIDKDNIDLTYRYHINGEDYIFMPESVAMTGAKGENNAQRYNAAFLDMDTWKAMSEVSQAIDLSSLNMGALTLNAENHPPTATIRQTKVNPDNYTKLQTTGYLFKKEDFDTFYDTYLKDTWYKWGSSYSSESGQTYGTGRGQLGGDIKGIATDKNGNLIYVTEAPRGYDQSASWITKDGPRYQWYNEPSGLLADIGNFFSSIPFLPEAIAIFVPGGAQFYPAMKGSQAYAAGGELGDVIASMATAYAGQTLATSNLANSMADSLVKEGVFTELATAKIASAAITNAAFNGSIAALTGGDISKAMVTGALTGGLSAGTPAIAEAIFGDVKAIDTMASSIGMNRAQFQNIVVGSVAQASVASAVNNQDFMDSLTSTLVSNGLSTVAANKVGSYYLNSIGKTASELNMSEKELLTKYTQNTRLLVQASARAAVRGEDINVALQRVAPQLAINMAR